VPGERQRQLGTEADGYRVSRIHHVGISVSKLDRSLAFYRDLLGMSVIGLSDDEDVGAIVGIPSARVRIADLDAGNGQILELLEYGSENTDGGVHGPDTVGSCHLSLQVGELQSALSRLESAGFMPIGERAELSIGGVWEDCAIVYVRDPDGVILELISQGTGD
jgi:catechol 2,3-dioxygenase-like lactoylglutathione lyase family enzyme